VETALDERRLRTMHMVITRSTWYRRW